MIESFIGVVVGLLLGFPIGFLCSKKAYDEKVFDEGFACGFIYGKDSFYNPQAKG